MDEEKEEREEETDIGFKWVLIRRRTKGKDEKMMEEITKELSLHLTAFIIGLV